MLKRLLAGLFAALTFCGTAIGQYATLTGSLAGSNGMPASNYILSFQISQFGFIAGTGVVVNTGTYCATSTDGSVVGVPNPLIAPPTTVGFTGTLPPANYFVKFIFYDAAANVTLASPETVIQLNSTGRLIVAAPTAGLPSGAVGMKVYISTTSGAETLQGTSTGSAAYVQSIPLVSGAALPSTNTTLCKQVANDAIWPTGTGYTVALTDPAGNTLPGYPMMWQLMGPNTTINLSNGLPYYHGTVYFPTPILASPLNHALQSISGPLSLTGYNLINVGAIGVGTSLPAWPIDVENGAINASGGYLVNGSGGTTGQCIGSDGTAFDVPVNCLTAGSLFYQAVQNGGTPVTQRPALNFSANFAVTDSSSPARTNVDLSTMDSLTPGAYTSANITVDQWGRITLAANGSGSSRVCNSNGCYIEYPDGTLFEWGVVHTGCTSGCVTAETFPHAFTTTTNLSVRVTCGDGLGNCLDAVSSITTSGWSIGEAAVVFNGGTGSALTGSQNGYWQASGN